MAWTKFEVMDVFGARREIFTNQTQADRYIGRRSAQVLKEFRMDAPGVKYTIIDTKVGDRTEFNVRSPGEDHGMVFAKWPKGNSK